jgi:hypothetical protein
MKSYVMVLVIAFLLFAPQGKAQSPHWMVGVLTSHFVNQSDEHRLSDANNPVGSGVLVGYQFDNSFALAITGEYADRDLEHLRGTEKMLRTHLSLIGFPVELSGIRLYTSAGLVLTNFSRESMGQSEHSSYMQGRFGIGADYGLYRNLGINVDAGFYTDGLNLKGWSNSVGFRYVLNR